MVNVMTLFFFRFSNLIWKEIIANIKGDVARAILLTNEFEIAVDLYVFW